MARYLDVQINSIRLRLLADRGVYWNDHHTLFIADTHFGKGATFRRHGIAVHGGSTAATISAIERMIEIAQPSRLIVLGDLFHARSSLAPDVCEQVGAFWLRHGDIEITLVQGNHDTHAGTLPTQWPIQYVPQGTQLGDIVLNHHPTRKPEMAKLLICGHLHPSIRVASNTDSLGKLDCFWLSRGCLVLPAVGKFTGRHIIKSLSNDRVWIVVDEEVTEVTTCLSHSRMKPQC